MNNFLPHDLYVNINSKSCLKAFSNRNSMCRNSYSQDTSPKLTPALSNLCPEINWFKDKITLEYIKVACNLLVNLAFHQVNEPYLPKTADKWMLAKSKIN